MNHHVAKSGVLKSHAGIYHHHTRNIKGMSGVKEGEQEISISTKGTIILSLMNYVTFIKQQWLIKIWQRILARDKKVSYWYLIHKLVEAAGVEPDS